MMTGILKEIMKVKRLEKYLSVLKEKKNVHRLLYQATKVFHKPSQIKDTFRQKVDRNHHSHLT